MLVLLKELLQHGHEKALSNIVVNIYDIHMYTINNKRPLNSKTHLFIRPIVRLLLGHQVKVKSI